eukprot:6502763-Lingulodinium_polyedra.AAC.1
MGLYLWEQYSLGVLVTVVVDHAAYRECGEHRVFESAPETVGRVVRFFQSKVHPDKWATGPNGPGHRDPSISHLGGILFQALEDV